MNVYLRELRAYRKSTITWVISLAGIVGLFMMLYPAFESDVEGLNEVLANFPQAIKSLVNITPETFLSVLGFYGYLLNFAWLAASIQAMNLGVGVISKEVAGKTADFLITRPVRRAQVVTAKLAAALTVVLITSAVFTAVSYLAVVATGASLDEATLLLMASTLLLLQIVFLALGALFSVTIPKIKSVVAVSLPTVFAFYIIGAIGDVLENVELRWVSPFRYFDPAYMIGEGALESEYLLVIAVFTVAAIAATYVIFAKKDIHTAI
ncbi:MAG: ABC transporter permease subunit [Coriobacteriia bacterium]|nr:ABC transporter permease subunit [Coriobacteriia bacterium]